MLSQSFIYSYQNHKIKVTIEFPQQPDQKAEQDFIGYLKEIYLKKLYGGISL